MYNFQKYAAGEIRGVKLQAVLTQFFHTVAIGDKAWRDNYRVHIFLTKGTIMKITNSKIEKLREQLRPEERREEEVTYQAGTGKTRLV